MVRLQYMAANVVYDTKACDMQEKLQPRTDGLKRTRSAAPAQSGSHTDDDKAADEPQDDGNETEEQLEFESAAEEEDVSVYESAAEEATEDEAASAASPASGSEAESESADDESAPEEEVLLPRKRRKLEGTVPLAREATQSRYDVSSSRTRKQHTRVLITNAWTHAAFLSTPQHLGSLVSSCSMHVDIDT